MLLEKVRTMSNPFSEEDVIGIIKNKDKNIDIRQVEKLYYPYMWLVFRAKTGKNKKNPGKMTYCMVDMVRGREAIGTGDMELEDIEVDAEIVMPAKFTEDEIVEKSKDFMLQAMLKQLKMLVIPELDLVDKELVHKLFYVVHCKDKDGKDFFIMVDSLEANLTILNP